MRRWISILTFAVVATVAPSAANADRAAAAEAMPSGGQPLLQVVRAAWNADAWDDAARRPEVIVYPDGQYLITKSDGRIWTGVLPRETTLDLMDFLLRDVAMPSLSMTYVVTSPVTTFTTYSFTTRHGTTVLRRRASGGFGTNVKTVEAALDRVDARILSYADQASRPYAPGRLLVVSRPVVPDPALPVWAFDDRLSFEALSAATDLVSRRGAILAAHDAVLVRDAVEQSSAWRLIDRAAEFRLRPALPHESSLPVWINPKAPVPPPTVPLPTVPTPAGTPTAGTPPLPTPPPVPPPPPAVPVPPVDPSDPRPAVPAGLLPDAPPPVSVPSPLPVPPPTSAGPTETSPSSGELDFAGVVKLLADLRRKTTGSPHGDFWKKDYDAFVAYEFALMSVVGRMRLLTPGDGANSNLVRALRGAPLVVLLPDGSTREEPFSVMPPKGAPMKPDDIERIRRWIDRGAHKDAPTGATTQGPASPVVPSTPTETAPTVVSQVSLVQVGGDEMMLGADATSEPGTSPPRFFVACDAAGWEGLFLRTIPAEAGPHNKTIATRLGALLLDAVKGYDWGTSPLLLVIGPATDGYSFEASKAVDVLSDGTGVITLTHAVSPGTPTRIAVRWALYRADAAGCPRALLLRTPTTTVPARRAD